MAPKLISSFFKTTTKLQADASMERELDRSIANQRVRELEEEKRKEEWFLFFLDLLNAHTVKVEPL